MTDKSTTLLMDGKHYGKWFTIKATHHSDPPEYTTSLYKVYCEASLVSDTAARVEIHVPLAHTATVLMGLQITHLEHSLVVYRRSQWWWVVISGFFSFPTNYHLLI